MAKFFTNLNVDFQFVKTISNALTMSILLKILDLVAEWFFFWLERYYRALGLWSLLCLGFFVPNNATGQLSKSRGVVASLREITARNDATAQREIGVVASLREIAARNDATAQREIAVVASLREIAARNDATAQREIGVVASLREIAARNDATAQREIGVVASLREITARNDATAQREVCAGLTVPWDIEWLGNDQLIFTEINGRIGKVNVATGEVKTLLQLPGVARELQAGLLGLALHPDFPLTKKCYVAFTSYKGDALVLRIAELIYLTENETLVFSKILFDDIPAAPTDVGGRLLASPEGYLFLTVGDLEQTERAQNPLSLNGKILRLNLDGSIPADNPFPGSPVWALGLRNSQGLAMAHGSLFCTEHGTMSDDELNLLEKGGNYGWQLVAGYCDDEPRDNCLKINAIEPLKAWTPTIAPAGLAFYHHERYAFLKNHLLIANLYDQSLKAVRLSPNGTKYVSESDLLSEAGRLRDVLVSPDGRIFVTTSNSDSYGAQPPGADKILEVNPSSKLTPDSTYVSPAPSTVHRPPSTVLQLDSTTLEIRPLVTGLVHPWDMTWGFDNRIWFTENGGWVKRLDPATGQLDTILRLGDCHFSWGNPGIYSLAFHPGFPKEPYLFVHYTNSPTNSKLVRFRYDFQRDMLTDSVSIIPKMTANESHNGSRIVFAPDGTMFFALGEAYTPELAQDLTSLNGKILRLNLDGSVPSDNPFPGSLIWSYGHRNPQGLALLPNGALWSSEHGANNDDELNIIRKGGNYGWSKVQGFCDLRSEKRYCAENQVIEPVIAWTPTVAPCALEYYDHPAIPEWRHSLMQVFLKKGKGKLGQRMTVFKLNEAGAGIVSQQDFFNNTYGRLRDVLIAPDGRVFLCTSNMEVSGNGKKAIRPGDDKILEVRAVK
jgi:glucose/arabinose dehydrogenase